MNKPIIMIGNGGHAAVLTDILLANKREILGFVAPIEEGNSFGLPYLGTDEYIESIPPNEIELALGIGSTKINVKRSTIYSSFRKNGYIFAQCIHPSVIIANSAELADGVQIMAGAIIQPRVSIAANTIINTGAIVEHDCKIGKHVHIAPGTVMSGNVHIGDCSHIGTGAKIIQNINIGHHVMIAAGSVVVKNIKDECFVKGVPAKEVKKYEEVAANISQKRNNYTQYNANN